jgi:hypothetical protein
LFEPSLPPTGLLSAILKRSARDHNPYGLTDATMAIIQDIYNATGQVNKIYGEDRDKRSADLSLHSCRYQQQKSLSLSVPNDTLRNASHEENLIHESCQLAAMIFWNIMDNFLPSPLPSAVLQHCLQDLKAALSKIDAVSWLRAAPEALIWICLTGAAGTQSSNQRGWFMARQGAVTMAIETKDVSVVKDGWRYFRWLRAVGQR